MEKKSRYLIPGWLHQLTATQGCSLHLEYGRWRWGGSPPKAQDQRATNCQFNIMGRKQVRSLSQQTLLGQMASPSRAWCLDTSLG